MAFGRKVVWPIVIIAVAVFAFFAFGGGPKTSRTVALDESLRVQAPALLPMDASKVTAIDLTLSDQRIVAAKEDGGWVLKQPYSDQASGEDIERVINLFSALASDEIAEEGNDATFGFNRPFAKATFTEDGEKREFIIGKPRPKEMLYYVRTSASPDTYIVRGIPEELAVLRPIDLVNRQLLSFNPDDIVRIEAATADGSLERVIERREGRWFAGKGQTGIVFEVEEFLRDLRYVNVSNLVSAASGQGLTPTGSTMHIVLTRQDGMKHILDIGDKTDDERRYYVKSSDRPHVYQVVQFIAENLRDKLQRVGIDMMGLNPDRVQELKLSTADDQGKVTEKTFTKSDGTWTTDGKVAFAVSGVLDSVIGVNAQQAAPDADDTTYGFNPAPGSMLIQATLDNKAVIKLDIGATTPDGQYRYVRSSARQGVYLSPAENVDIILSSVARVRSELMVFDPAKVNRITVYESDWGGQTSSRTVTKSGSQWTFDGKTVNSQLVETFLTNLRGLGAESIPPPEDEATYGFYPAAESWRVELRFTDGGSLILDTGARKSEGSGWFAIVNYYVRISDLTDVVFVGEFDIDGLKDAFATIVR
jgi:hypothetical protein